jgi:hypothetical protein
MRSLHGFRGASLALILALVGAGAATGRPQDRPEDERMSVPGGTAALLKTVHVPGRVESARAWLVLTRALHGDLPREGPPVSVATIEPYLLEAGGRGGLAADEVPALLPRAVWEQAVFGRPVEPDQLAFSILRDRRAAFLYAGLFSLDPETLAYFAAHPSLVSSIYGDHSGAFAAFAESLTVREARMVLPGGLSRALEWEGLVGARAIEPDRFIPALLDRDGGRLAWLFDTIASLDAARQTFALREGIDRLYEAFKEESLPVGFSARPFTRPPVDGTILLRTIGVASDGTLVPPRDAALWSLVFKAGGSTAGAEVSAAWLLRAFASAPTPQRRLRLETVLFAQRVFTTRSRAAVPRSRGAHADARGPRLHRPARFRECGANRGRARRRRRPIARLTASGDIPGVAGCRHAVARRQHHRRGDRPESRTCADQAPRRRSSGLLGVRGPVG